MPRRFKISKKRKLSILDKVLLGMSVLGAMLLLLSYLAPSTDPRDVILIALLGFGYPVLVAINLVFLLYWAIRKSPYFFLPLLTILVGFWSITANVGFFGEQAPIVKNDTSTIRLCTFNVSKFLDADKFSNGRSDSQIYSLFRTRRPDVLCLEEFVVQNADKGAVSDSLSKLTNPGYRFFYPFRTGPVDSSGVAIFSRFPIVASGRVPSPEALATVAIFADLDIRGNTVRVYAIHLAAVQIKMSQKEKYLNGNVDLTKSGFIKNRLAAAFIRRSYQVSKIKQHVADSPYPTIVAGDFNDTPVSFAVNELGDGLKNAFREKGKGYVSTYYNNFPRLHIDHVLVSPDFDVLSYEAVDKRISDHKPVIVDIRLNP